MRDLLPHQKKALNWAGKKARIALLMQMRLGKSIISIRWASQFKAPRRLVICPLTSVDTWQDEFKLERQSSTALTGSQKQKSKLLEDPTGWCITNYEACMVRKNGRYVLSELAQQDWDLIILDESPAIKNPKAYRTKLITRAFDEVKYKAILSGLPNPHGWLDFFMQFLFLLGEFMGCDNFWNFRHRHFYKAGFTFSPRKGTLDRMKKAIDKVAFTQTQAQAGLKFSKNRIKRYCELPAKIRKAYRTCIRDFEMNGKQTKWAVVKSNWLMQMAGGYPKDAIELHSDHKLKLLLTLLDELGDEPVLVWFAFNAEIEHVRKALAKLKITSGVLTGEVPRLKRAEAVKKFQAGKIRVLLLQVKCGKFSLDLSRASTAIYYSNNYDLEDRKQSEERIVHPLKREPLLYIDLVAKGSSDEPIVAALTKKHINVKLFQMNLIANLKRKLINGKN